MFLMGVKALGQIVARLLERGENPNKPVALVRWGTTGQQQVVTGTLQTIEDEDELETEDETKTVSVGDKTTKKEEDSSPARTSTMKLSVTVSEPTGSPSPLPAAFDGNIASEFKSADEDDSCPNFIENLLGSSEFQRCYPFSMLVQVRQLGAREILERFTS